MLGDLPDGDKMHAGGQEAENVEAEVGPRLEGVQRAGRRFTGLSQGATWSGDRPGPGKGEKVSRARKHHQITGCSHLPGHVQACGSVKMLTFQGDRHTYVYASAGIALVQKPH